VIWLVDGGVRVCGVGDGGVCVWCGVEVVLLCVGLVDV